MAGASMAAPLTYPSTVKPATAAVDTASTPIGQRRRQASARQATATRSSAAGAGCGMWCPRNWIVSEGDRGWPSP